MGGQPTTRRRAPPGVQRPAVGVEEMPRQWSSELEQSSANIGGEEKQQKLQVRKERPHGGSITPQASRNPRSGPRTHSPRSPVFFVIVDLVVGEHRGGEQREKRVLLPCFSLLWWI